MTPGQKRKHVPGVRIDVSITLLSLPWPCLLARSRVDLPHPRRGCPLHPEQTVSHCPTAHLGKGIAYSARDRRKT